MQTAKRRIRVNVLKGEPLDGSGRVCIHLFVVDETGPFIEPHALHPEIGEDGQPVKQKVIARPTRGRLACDPNKEVAPVTISGITTITARSDDPRAVTCPKCIASKDYVDKMARLGTA